MVVACDMRACAAELGAVVRVVAVVVLDLGFGYVYLEI